MTWDTLATSPKREVCVYGAEERAPCAGLNLPSTDCNVLRYTCWHRECLSPLQCGTAQLCRTATEGTVIVIQTWQWLPSRSRESSQRTKATVPRLQCASSPIRYMCEHDWRPDTFETTEISPSRATTHQSMSQVPTELSPINVQPQIV